MTPTLRPFARTPRALSRPGLSLLVIAVLLSSVNAISGPDIAPHSPIAHVLDPTANSAQQAVLGAHNTIPTPEDDSESPLTMPPGEDQDVHWPLNPLEELHDALETMQSRYFELWLGQWPSAIDWTAAVIGTLVSATLSSLTRSLEYVLPGAERPAVEGQRIENEIGKYFSQSVAYYFGEDAFSIRMEAFDDMLWVVLGWLESIKFIHAHSSRHYRPSGPARAWYGRQFSTAFAHRARIFYDLASQGWDNKLCGGGMTWNPRLTPYKNAITNQLFISASIGMYLYFPGDDNASPFMAADVREEGGGLPSARPHDRKYLQAAVDGYNWLSSSNMTNKQGLYVDGYHIKDWGKNGTIGTGKCDERNEMVYTYNQGVLLSGLRGLWEGTGEQRYLEDGHELVRNVMAATGWQEHEEWRRKHGRSGHHHGRGRKKHDSHGQRARWKGLGRDGVLEEQCDANGSCSQNGQTFKGIFFHHLTLFCEPLPLAPRLPGFSHGAGPATASLHRQSCKEYAPWVAHNARMAMRTRDEEGRFGMWWAAPEFGADDEEQASSPPLPLGAVDYRNNDTLPRGAMWMPLKDYDWWGGEAPADARSAFMGFDPAPGADAADRRATAKGMGRGEGGKWSAERADIKDKNDRGRGRTVETQGGGVAVLRAMWEFVNMYREY